ncbi:E3 ubiquitin-protein ligase RNF14 [Macrosteles quadrilineatus]|uniref:E3 ubiquitin-protein ligase RNF14 n=1 Tax=Macrosteles quadrilineatus TaxID=74068 RepID=UPI0023E29D3C|nr:E3 ubiquitin-protein ligase RNF14 [Macrosteles quadrilineatus]
MSSSSNRESHSKDIKISPGAVVCVESKLKGSVSIGSMTIIHPKASIIAEAGQVIIGENNIIEEQASIIYRSRDDTSKENAVPLNIGVNNVFEVGCEIHAKSIGDHNVFESKCYVGPNVEIGNGCIIGAGCRITVSERLPDLTVITGQECVRRLALDKPPGCEDLTRQLDELTVMSEIFTKEEFSSSSACDQVTAVFEAHVPLPCDFTLSLSQESGRTSFPINHLPPIRLCTSFPKDYPSISCPDFLLSCCWLSKTKLELLVMELNKLWDENKCEILFIWCSFLKDQSLDLLNITNSYELCEKDPTPKSEGSESCLDQIKQPYKLYYSRQALKDKRNNNRFDQKRQEYSWRKNRGVDYFARSKVISKLTKEANEKFMFYHKECVKRLFFNLIDYNASKSKDEFSKNMQDCNVCFSQVIGEQCKQLNCGHITCVECLRRLCQVHIEQGTMECIVCPQENCGLELPANLINDLVSKELYDRYDRLMLNRTLDKISNMTYCPRPACQYPISTQDEESLAVCPSCGFALCVFCRRVYHGIEGCRLKSEEKSELVEAYKNADREKRLDLEKRYGKKQLTELVNTADTEAWMSQNSKKCPCCNINIEKNDGCNKMICRKCNTNFCWLCLARVSSLNPYLHYQDPKSKCFNLLFEGIEGIEDIEDIEEEDEGNEEVVFFVPDEAIASDDEINDMIEMLG